jgi:hypothetical protein
MKETPRRRIKVMSSLNKISEISWVEVKGGRCYFTSHAPPFSKAGF